MKYLEKFELVDEELNPDFVKKVKNSYSKDEWFPLGFFAEKQLRQVDFEEVTIFYGGNGSGKSTLLSMIAEKLYLRRHSDTAPTKAFYDYCDLCKVRRIKNMPGGSKMLTSEDVFKNIFTTRNKNAEIEEKKAEVEELFDYNKADDFVFDGFESHELISKRLVKKSFVEKRSGVKERQYSNGENAMRFFKKEIQKKTLYLLDEPENSMSPKFQLELKTLLEDYAEDYGCQFIIATHSPFILSINDAKVYDLDGSPVSVEKWHNLQNIRLYYSFFKENAEYFESGGGPGDEMRFLAALKKQRAKEAAKSKKEQ